MAELKVNVSGKTYVVAKPRSSWVVDMAQDLWAQCSKCGHLRDGFHAVIGGTLKPKAQDRYVVCNCDENDRQPLKEASDEPIAKLEFHELANVFPLLAGDQLQELSDDIKANGLREQIVMHEGKILDGRNRYNAVTKYALKFGADDFRDFDPETEGDPVQFVISKNIMRRHLTVCQRAALLSELLDLVPKQKPGPKTSPPGIKSGIPEVTSPAGILNSRFVSASLKRQAVGKRTGTARERPHDIPSEGLPPSGLPFSVYRLSSSVFYRAVQGRPQ
jgi:hypothetical protein